MKVVWSKQARNQLASTSDYIKRKFGVQSKRKFLNKIRELSDILEENPDIGQHLQLPIKLNYKY